MFTEVPAFFKRSYSPTISLPSPTPTSPSSVLLSTLFVWSHMAAFVFPVFVCVFVTAANQPRQRGPRGIDQRYQRRRLHAGRWRKKEKKKERKKEGGVRRGEGGAFWSAAKCTKRSGGNARELHLFKAAGHRFTLDRPPSRRRRDGFVCCRLGPGWEE